ncbi:glycoside hydrolase family 61 protein [Tricholoma matsutake]|nr:glycoside hydrolase family 61 protein [Tricholoma matsutake 945]
MLKLILTLAISLLATLVSVQGHGYVQEVIISGVTTYIGYLPYSDPYYHSPPKRIIRKIPGDGPVTDVSSIDVQCNGWTAGGFPGSAPAPLFATVAAGSDLTLKWTKWPASHVGPIITYMARAQRDITQWYPNTSAVWFKIAEAGKSTDASGTAQWATSQLIASNNTYTFTIPRDLQAGQYIIRNEIIALHKATTYPGAQLYPSCIQVQVTGSGSAFPTSFVSFPGAYNDTRG